MIAQKQDKTALTKLQTALDGSEFIINQLKMHVKVSLKDSQAFDFFVVYLP